MRIRCLAALLLSSAWFAALPVASDDSSSHRRIGFSSLTGGDLEPEQRYLAEKLPKLLRERLLVVEGVALVDVEAPVDLLPRQISTAFRLDLLIWGQLSLVGERLVLELYAFDAALVRHVWSYLDSGDANMLIEAVEPIADELASLLLGGPWARLAVDVIPVDSTVRLDGILIGIGTTLLRYIAPRRATLSVSRPGYRNEVQQVELAAGQELRIAVKLSPVDLGTVLLDSLPGSALVYIASAYAGVTPLRLPRPTVDMPAKVALKGYAEAAVRIGPTTPDVLTVALQPADYDNSVLQAQQRDLFYEELGWFMASLLPPLLLSAIATDLSYRDAALQTEGGPIVWQPATIGVTIGAVVAVGYSAYRLLSTLGAMINYTEAADWPVG